MCLWVRALDVYGRMVKVVEPKRQALHRAEAALAEVQAKLTAKRQQLKYVTPSHRDPLDSHPCARLSHQSPEQLAVQGLLKVVQGCSIQHGQT